MTTTQITIRQNALLGWALRRCLILGAAAFMLTGCVYEPYPAPPPGPVAVAPAPAPAYYPSPYAYYPYPPYYAAPPVGVGVVIGGGGYHHWH